MPNHDDVDYSGLGGDRVDDAIITNPQTPKRLRSSDLSGPSGKRLGSQYLDFPAYPKRHVRIEGFKFPAG
jgi:hypothetical protein